MADKLSASEAVYGFAAWLTTRDARTVMSSSDDSAPIAELCDRFVKANKLAEPRERWAVPLEYPARRKVDR